MDRQKYVHGVLLLIVCVFSFFLNNQVIYPDIMESRNLVTAHEMVEYDNWLVPTMNGELRLEKPPLPTWIAASIDKISPDNLVLQRAAAGILATLLVFFIYALAVRLTNNRRYGLIAALVLCTSFNIILMGRTATWDIYCHSFMLGAILFLFRGFEGSGYRWWDFVWAGVLMGLSFLGKGPVSFYALLLPFLITYFAIYRPSVRHKLYPLLLMIGICLFISLWWPLYLYIYHRDMAVSVAAKESTAWINRNVRPWYYYWKFFLETGIWALLLVTALIWPYWKNRFKLKKEYLLVVCWTFAVLILLSLLPEKKTRYLLPILIPATLVIAHLLNYWFELWKSKTARSIDRVIFGINSSVVALVAFVLPVAIYILFYAKGFVSLPFFIMLVLLFWGIAVFLVWTSFKFRPLSFLWGVVILFMSMEALLMPSIAVLFNNQDLKSIRAVRDISEINEFPFYYPADEELRIELVYEAGRRILPWNIQQDTSLLQKLPFVLVSAKSAEEILPPAIQAKVNLKLIDVYDDNHRQKNTSWYSGTFIRYVTLITPKEE